MNFRNNDSDFSKIIHKNEHYTFLREAWYCVNFDYVYQTAEQERRHLK